MKKLITSSLMLLALSALCMGQSGVVVTGGTSSGSGGSLSSSTGQISTVELSGPGGSASPGNQSVTTSTPTSNARTYSGNGRGGFGGPVGGSTLEIDDDGTTMTWTFTKGPGNFNDVMVIYLDTPGGFLGRTSTADINDTADPGRRAISNAGSGDLTFPSGFGTEYAITVETGFIGLWSIPAVEQFSGTITNLPAPTSLGTTFSSTDSSFSFTLDLADIGNVSTFDFIITYGNGSANGNTAMFSSDEAYGGNITGGNPGTNAFSISSYETYANNTILFQTTASATTWSDPDSWNHGVLPRKSNPVGIITDLNVDIDVTIDNDTSNSASFVNGATMTIDPGVVFTVNGTFFVGSSPGTELVFDSDINGSAQLINNNATAINGGDVTTLRYIPALTNNRKAYRFISSPVMSTGTVYDNWQLGGLTTPGFGTHITGSSTGANGFDATISGNPSMLEFRVISTGERNWAFVTQTDEFGLAPGEARALYVRGDRNFDLTTNGNPNSDTKLPLKGRFNLAASITDFVNDRPNGFDFVGNPYQATIDMTAVTKNGINPNFMYIWDPNAASQGAYETIDISTGSTDPKRFVEPGQSFFVVNGPTTEATTNVIFTAASKAPNNTGAGSFSINNARPSMNVQLWSNNVSPVRYDTALFNFDGDNAVNAMDAPEIGNFEENLSINKNGTLLSIENRAMPIDSEVILFDFSNVNNSDFELRIVLDNLALNLNAFLVDSFLNTEIALNDGTTNIPFTVDLTNNNSFSNDRFSIRFEDGTLSNDRIDTLTFNMFPNPTADLVTIQLGSGYESGQVSFYNFLGQKVKTMMTDASNNKIDISDLSSGVYLVKIISGNEEVTKKLIKE